MPSGKDDQRPPCICGPFCAFCHFLECLHGPGAVNGDHACLGRIQAEDRIPHKFLLQDDAGVFQINERQNRIERTLMLSGEQNRVSGIFSVPRTSVVAPQNTRIPQRAMRAHVRWQTG